MLRDLIERALVRAGRGDGEARRIVPLSSCLEAYGNDLALVFDGGATPAFVFKAARDPGFNFKIDNEAAMLRRAATIAGVGPLAPQAIAAGRLCGRSYLIQQGLAGASQANVLREAPWERAVGSLEQGIDLLVRLNGAPAMDGAPSVDEATAVDGATQDGATQADQMDDAAAGTDADPATAIAPHAAGRNSLELGQELLDGGDWSDAERGQLATALERGAGERRWMLHGDFWPTNLLTGDDGVVGLIDWEFATSRGGYPSDVAWYVLNAIYFLAMREQGRVGIDAAFERHAFDDGPIAEVACMLLQRYREGLGIELDACDAFVVTLLQLSQRERRAYGAATNMDGVCAGMLRGLLQRQEAFRLGARG